MCTSKSNGIFLAVTAYGKKTIRKTIKTEKKQGSKVIPTKAQSIDRIMPFNVACRVSGVAC